jgi:BirA family biotin operon repressor/biotin-[acetyl-CoA-carboxylase] ligase
VADGLKPFVDASDVQLKWPNDVYYARRKLAGILVESTLGQLCRVVIGIGVNVNNSLAPAPADIRARAVSLVDCAGPLSLTAVLLGIVNELAEQLQRLEHAPAGFVDEWRARCLLTGREVEITMGARRLRGLCLGIDVDGALRLRTPAGEERCHAGVVTQAAGLS